MMQTPSRGEEDMNSFQAHPPAPGWTRGSQEIPPPPPSETIARVQDRKEDKVERKVSPARTAIVERTTKKDGSRFDLAKIQVETLKVIFTLLDSDQDGLLDVKQLSTAIISMGIPPSPKLINDVLNNVPEKQRGLGVDFDTFRTVITDRMRRNPVKMSDIDELFRSFEDKTHEGIVSDSYLRHIMEVKTTQKTHLSDDEVDEIFGELGIMRRDPINYREFMKKMSSGFVNFV